jgi:hypothetical protein
MEPHNETNHTADELPIIEPSPLQRALAALGDGGQVQLARRCDVTPQAITGWIKKDRVPPEHVLTVEKETGVSRHELRSDVFGPVPSAPPGFALVPQHHHVAAAP